MEFIRKAFSGLKVSLTGTLQRYILTSFLVAAGLTGLVLTFVLSVGFLFQVFQFIIQGAPAGLILEYLAASLPEVLGFTIPLALMVASLLVFGRLSTDSEIAAMKACGVSFFAIMRGPLIVAFLCTALGFYLQNYAMPRGHYVRRSIATRIALNAGVNLIEPGRFIDEIDNVTIFCDRKVEGENAEGKKITTLYGLLAIDNREGFKQEIKAERAEMQIDGNDVIFVLYQPRIFPATKESFSAAHAKQFPYTCKNVVSRRKEYLKKPKDFTFGELWQAEEQAKLVLKDAEQRAAEGREKEGSVSVEGAEKYHSKLRFLLHYRTVWALSAFCFVIVGIPLGCQSQRKDSARGMTLGLGIGILFFLFILLSEALADKASACPWLLVWIPVVLCLGASVYLIKKNQ